MKFTDPFVEQFPEFVDVFTLFGRDEEAVVVEFSHPSAHQFVERDVLLGAWREVVSLLLHPCVGIYLVEENHLGFVGTAEVAEGLFHHLYLFLEIGMADIALRRGCS